MPYTVTCAFTTLWLLPFTILWLDYTVTCALHCYCLWLLCDLYLWLYCDLYHTMTCAYHCTLKCHPPTHLTFSFTFILFYCFIRYLSKNTSIYWFSCLHFIFLAMYSRLHPLHEEDPSIYHVKRISGEEVNMVTK